MIVKCIHKIKKKDENLDSIIVDKEYLVIDITYRNLRLFYNILEDDNSCSLHDLDRFEIVDARIPPDYVVEFFKVTEDYYIYGWSPTEFKGNFWNEDYDEVPKYAKIYKDTIRRLKEFHNWPITDEDYYHEPEVRHELKEHEWWKDPKNWE